MTDAVIVTQGLGRRFQRAGDTVRALAGLDVEVERGEVLGLVGHNGAGKTTTVRLLNGVLAPSEGGARVFGLDPQRDGPRVRARSGVLTETPALDERLGARETLELFGRIFGLARTDARTRAGALLHEFGLSERSEDRVGSFSKGMKQRLALARTLIHAPELIFLDEPTAGLDPVVAREVHELIRRLTVHEGRTVVLCTHNLLEAQRLCTRVAVLQRGELVALGSPAELSRRLERGARVRIEVPAERVEAALAALRGALRELPAVQVRPEQVHPERVRQEGLRQEGLRQEGLRQEGVGALRVEGAGRQHVAAGVAALVAAGVDVFAVVPADPTLEDAYFALVDGAPRNRARS